MKEPVNNLDSSSLPNKRKVTEGLLELEPILCTGQQVHARGEGLDRAGFRSIIAADDGREVTKAGKPARRFGLRAEGYADASALIGTKDAKVHP